VELEKEEHEAQVERELVERLLEYRARMELIGQVLGGRLRVVGENPELLAGPQAPVETPAGIACDAMRRREEKGTLGPLREVLELRRHDDEGLLHRVVELGPGDADPREITREGASILLYESTETALSFGWGERQRRAVHPAEGRCCRHEGAV
jgi:hypothetical protein